MLGKVNNIIRVPTSLDTTFFKYWLEFISPLHKLPPKAIEVAAAFLQKRYELSKSIIEDEVLDKVVLGVECKKELMETCGMSKANFDSNIKILKQKLFLVDNKINPKFIPKNINANPKAFQLLLYFDLNEEGNS